MDEIKIQKELQKPIGAALPPLEWFILFSFVDHAMKKDEMFASQEDMESMSATVKRLHDQVFPPKRDNLEEFENLLKIPEKKLILPQGGDLIV